MPAGPKPLPTAGLRPLPGVVVRHQPTKAPDPGQGIDTEQVFRHHVAKHTVKHQLHVANAAKALDRLPEPGECIHVLMSGNFAGFDFVPAVLRLAAPATIDELHVATLGFNERNSGELLDLLDAGTIRRVWFVASHYFKGTSAGIYDPLAAALEKRGMKIVANRNHAKLLAMRLSDGRCITLDGSMNLRSCRNVEQANMTNSPELFEFYAGYIRQSCEGDK